MTTTPDLHELATDPQAQRQAEKDARNTAKFAKTLTEAEQFRTTGRFSERVTTVAKCKELIRMAVEARVELEWINQPEREHDMQGFTETIARMRANRADQLAERTEDAAHAENVLIAREDAHEGWGMTEKDIDLMKARKLKSARKEWRL